MPGPLALGPALQPWTSALGSRTLCSQRGRGAAAGPRLLGSLVWLDNLPFPSGQILLQDPQGRLLRPRSVDPLSCRLPGDQWEMQAPEPLRPPAMGLLGLDQLF